MYTDLNYLLNRTKSNSEIMKEMISLYLEQTPPLVSTVKQSLQAKDWTSLYVAVHKMIPSFAIVGISIEYENMAKQIQEYASKQYDAPDLNEVVLKIEHVCTEACKELEEEFNKIKNNN